MSVIKSAPITITAIVYSAEGLKPKKKDKHKFCVIFGCGHQKFRTDIIEDLFNRPTFNTECEIPVDDVTQPLTFVITEKNEKDVLGQVIVPLGELTTFRTNHKERVPLRAHKKCPHAEGELVFEAWISSGTITSNMLTATIEEESDDKKTSSAVTGLKKLRDKLTHSPMLMRKPASQHKRTNSDGLPFPLQQSSSVSCQDLMSSSGYSNRLSVVDANKRRPSATSANADADSIDSVDGTVSVGVIESSTKPEVTGVSPKEGPVEGGTRLTIRGVNLGRNKEDVVGLYVCGSNVLSTLEYFSSSKLMCTTKAFRASTGNIVVETQSGGRGLSLVQFTFLSPPTAITEGAPDNVSEASSSLSRSSSRGDADFKREGSLRSTGDRDSTFSNSKIGSKARSMFDLSLSSKHVTVVPSPEVTGVSPCDGPAASSTRLVIRGANLGRSRADIVSVTVAGVDCTSSLEYESSTRLTCIAGPTPSRATCSGDVIVETKSGGVGVSTVQFSFVESSVESDTNEWAAIPYDAISAVTQSQPAADSPPASSSVLPTLSQSVASTATQQQSSPMQSVSTTVSPFNVVSVQGTKQPPPVVEIQPMSRSSSTSAVPPVVVTTTGVNKSSTHRKSAAPLPPAVSSPGVAPLQIISENGHLNSSLSTEDSTYDDYESKEKIRDLYHQLSRTTEQVKQLQVENKMLKDENERMRLYMESLVSRAIAVCPQILCVDSKTAC